MTPLQTARRAGLLFTALVFFSALTGFAQMPIFKRYYIADLPGLGWLAQYFTTYSLHLLSAYGLLAIGAYYAVVRRLMPGRARKLSVVESVRAGLLVLIGLTGVLLALRNLPGYLFSPQAIIALNFAHLGLVMVFLAMAATMRLLRKQPVAG